MRLFLDGWKGSSPSIKPETRWQVKALILSGLLAPEDCELLRILLDFRPQIGVGVEDLVDWAEDYKDGRSVALGTLEALAPTGERPSTSLRAPHPSRSTQLLASLACSQCEARLAGSLTVAILGPVLLWSHHIPASAPVLTTLAGVTAGAILLASSHHQHVRDRAHALSWEHTIHLHEQFLAVAIQGIQLVQVRKLTDCRVRRAFCLVPVRACVLPSPVVLCADARPVTLATLRSSVILSVTYYSSFLCPLLAHAFSLSLSVSQSKLTHSVMTRAFFPPLHRAGA